MNNNRTNKQIKPATGKPNSRWPLYALILLSGAAGLIYEVVWARQLTLFIGNTAIANAAVLTAFMLGLALGSLVLGRKADRISNPLGLYVLLEVIRLEQLVAHSVRGFYCFPTWVSRLRFCWPLRSISWSGLVFTSC